MDSARLLRFIDRHEATRRLWRLIVNLDRHDCWRAANAITFDAFLSFIPLLAIAGYVLHRLNQSGDLLFDPLLRTAPSQIAVLTDTEFLRLSEEGALTLAPISILGFLWLSASGMSTTMGVFDLIYKAEQRSWYHRRLLAIGLVFVTLVVVTGAAVGTVGLIALVGPRAAPAVAIATPTLVIVASVAGFFRVAIRRPAHVKRRYVPGALVTVALWAVVSLLFSFYVRVFAAYATFYGSLATVAILLFWIWLLALALLVGGEVNADLEGVRDEDAPAEGGPAEGGPAEGGPA